MPKREPVTEALTLLAHVINAVPQNSQVTIELITDPENRVCKASMRDVGQTTAVTRRLTAEPGESNDALVSRAIQAAIDMHNEEWK